MNLVFGIPLRPEVGNLGKNNFGKRFGMKWSAYMECRDKEILFQRNFIHCAVASATENTFN